MEWKIVNEDYLNYLRHNETRIPHSNYGEDKYKPFFGILFETNDFCYVTQISHAKNRHELMKENVDFHKIYHPKNNKLLAVVNLNYMFPVPKCELVTLEYKNIHLYRTFQNEVEKSKYISLLKIELKQINLKNLSVYAKKIYTEKYKFPDSNLARRCIDFKAMERLAQQWINNGNT